jgi:hypothetical protein
MVDRFERNKLYINSNNPTKIVKCEFIAPRGSAVLTFVCKNPEYKATFPSREELERDILSSSPENWDEFTLPEVPGITGWAVSFLSNVSGRRNLVSDIYPSEDAAREYTNRGTPEKRERAQYQVHPIIISARQTLEEFVRYVENLEETV